MVSYRPLVLGILGLSVDRINASLTWKTFDISSLIVEENDNSVTYKDTAGNTGALEDMVAAAGANSIKIRLWVDPSDGNYNLAYGVELGKRAAAAGLDVVLNLHYSDTWADAGNQAPPAAWASMELDELAATVQEYTQNVLDTFADAGVSVSLVGLGNEIRAGLLFPLGSYENFANMGTLLSAAVKGARASSSSGVKTMLHLDQGYSWGSQQWFYDSLSSSGTFDLADIDVQGVSYYPYWDATESTLANFEEAVNNMASAYGKEVVVVETDWPTECKDASSLIPFSLRSSVDYSAAGQVDWATDIANVLANVPNGLGTGLMYWEPAWVDNESLGSGCESAVLFSAQWSGNSAVATALDSFNMFQSID